ncbi:porin [Methylobacterium sp. JK268]
MNRAATRADGSRLVKRFLLASAAGLTVVSGAKAADLPAKKAAPVDYVRVCTAHGVGFFYIPGTDTCIRLGGFVRVEANYANRLSRATGDLSGFDAIGRLNMDARTSTGYGTLRAFVRMELGSRTGSLFLGFLPTYGMAYGATGIDTAGRVQQYANVDKAFIQFAGLTAGRASSFFDFYAHDYEIIGQTFNSDITTNLLAYTAQFGGFSATASIEDPNLRTIATFGGGAAGTGLTGSQAPGANYAPIVVRDGTGAPIGFVSQDVVQRSRLPDFVGSLRYDAAWGAAQLSGAVHNVNAGLNSAVVTGLTNDQIALLPATVNPAARAATAYGWAVQGGIKVNLPFIAAGDALYLEGAYGEGAPGYTGYYNFGWPAPGSVVNPVTGKIDLSKSFTVVGSLLHYWTPTWRSAVFGSYGEQYYARNVRFNNALFGVAGLPVPTTDAGVAALAVSPLLRDSNQITAGASLIWSPVRDLDIGVEGAYVRQAVNSGNVLDTNKSGLNLASATAAQIAAAPKVSSQDTFNIRMRIQRDF